MVKDRKGRKSTVVAEDAEMPMVNGNEKLQNGKTLVNGQGKNVEKNLPLGVRVQKNSKKGSQPAKPSQPTPGGSQCVLLTQGIMANDSEKVDAVLRTVQNDIIHSTLRELQPMHVLPLLKEIENRLRTRKAADIRPTIRWAQCVFSVHMAYLCSLPNLDKEIGGLLSWLRARVDHQKELLALHGKISLIADQIKKRTNTVVIAPQPLVVFNNDLDSDSEEFETIGSDEDAEGSEDDWWEDNELKEGDEDENDSDQESDDSDNEEMMNSGNESNSSSDHEEEDEDMEVG
ncbi:unnamed protein product [Caenorhabditis bovis]|uniref:Small-subunit processome Utp12 domain-containing protein n=1 Tax=Caenorhabditis bovis TaxID=2654633 RepID=A0A8S1EM85_9PELO|nr:unnamed protein product [Caenorhabditis bovis]